VRRTSNRKPGVDGSDVYLDGVLAVHRLENGLVD
jgi:hypothetical protein